jgi:regulator of sigma E protease
LEQMALLLAAAAAAVICTYLVGGYFARSLRLRSGLVIEEAGPITNCLVGLLLFAGSVTFGGVVGTIPLIGEVVPDGPGARAGFRAGDAIVSVDGQRIESLRHAQRIISTSANRQLTFEVNREGVLLELRATPERREIADRFGNKVTVRTLGLRYKGQRWEYPVRNPRDAARLVAQESYTIGKIALEYVEYLAHREEFGGLVPETLEEVPSAVLSAFINLVAVLSVGFGVIIGVVKFIRWSSPAYGD